MVTIVVIINTLIALTLFYVAWRVRQLHRRVARVTDRLSLYERKIHLVLPGTPEAISIGRLAIHKLRQGSPMDLKLIRVQQVLTLFGVGQQIWQRSRLVRPRFLKKVLPKSR